METNLNPKTNRVGKNVDKEIKIIPDKICTKCGFKNPLYR